MLYILLRKLGEDMSYARSQGLTTPEIAYRRRGTVSLPADTYPRPAEIPLYLRQELSSCRALVGKGGEFAYMSKSDLKRVFAGGVSHQQEPCQVSVQGQEGLEKE